MLMSRNRANSFELLAPQPSTMLNAIDSAEFVICERREPFSVRGKIFTALRTSSTSSCALLQTRSLRKSCTDAYSPYHRSLRRHFPSTDPETAPIFPLKTTDDGDTELLSTQDL